MALARYGVLAGQVVDRRAEGGSDTPHYQVHVRGGGVEFRVAVNVLSQQQPSELLYVADEAFGPRKRSAAKTARHQQGLLHLYRLYCEARRCYECPISGAASPK